MKTAIDICRDYPGASFATGGRDNFFTCVVTLTDGTVVKGISATLEGAEDTAWHGVAITLRDA